MKFLLITMLLISSSCGRRNNLEDDHYQRDYLRQRYEVRGPGEAKMILEQAAMNGTVRDYDGVKWFTYEGYYLFTSHAFKVVMNGQLYWSWRVSK